MKKVAAVLLCLAFLFGQIDGVVYGDSKSKHEGEAKASSSVITYKGVLDRFGIDEKWLNKKLVSGYSLYQVYSALEAEKNGEASAESWLGNQKIGAPIVGESGVAGVVSDALRDTQDWLLKSTDGSIGTNGTAGNSVDEAALKDVGLQADASLYRNPYGEDAVALSTGDLLVSSTDLTLPGLLPFDLVRTYDSSKANEQIGVHYNDQEGTYQNESKIRKDEIISSLGIGWHWELPAITKRDGVLQIYIPSVGSYNLTDNLQLDGYDWNDLTLQSDTSVTVDGINSKYRLSVLNGYDYFLNEEGNLLQIKDGYSNHVDFKYTTLDSEPVLKQIINNEGNAINFTYSGLQVSIQLQGTERKMTYQKAVVGKHRVLGEVTDSMKRTTKYMYAGQDSRFNFVPDLAGNSDQQGIFHSELLVQIIHPSSASTEISYAVSEKKIGESATEHVFKVRGRKNVYSTTSGEVLLNNDSLEYSGQDLVSYGKSAEWTTTVKNEKSQEVYTFSKIFDGVGKPDVLRLKQQIEEGEGSSYTTKYSYDESVNRNTPTQVEESAQQSGTASEKLISTYAYDEQGMLLSGKLSTGQETTYTYQSSAAPFHWKLPSRVVFKVNDSLQQVTLYSYNSQGSELKNEVHHNSGGLLLAQTEQNVDDKGRVLYSKTKDGDYDIVTTFSYDSPYGSYLATSSSVIVHDASSKQETLTEKITYAPAGEVKELTDASGKTQSYEYDAIGRITKSVYKDGTQSTVAYDDINSLVTRTAPDGIITKEQYNPFGLLVNENTGLANYKYSYDVEGNIISSTDAEGNRTEYVSDPFGRLVQTKYPNGTSDLTDYNIAEHTRVFTDAEGNKTRETTDMLGRTLTIEEWMDGSFVPLEKNEYDLAGNVVGKIDGNGQKTQYTYDAIGQILTVTTPDQQTTRYRYSLTGNVLSIMYPSTETASWQYDELGRLIKETDPKKQVTSYFYDQRGNLTRLIDRQGRATEFTYSSEDLLTGIKAPDASASYTYDQMDRRKTMTDEHGKITYGYQAEDGMLKSMIYPDGTRIDYENNTQQRIGYTVTDPQGASMRVHGELDELNRLISMDVSIETGGVQAKAAVAASPLDHMTFDYSANSMLKKIAYGNGLQTAFEYKNYDLSAMNIQQSGKALHSYNYVYDKNKNIISRTQNGAEDQFTYDPLNRIQSETGSSQKQTYSYSPNGNRKELGSGKIFGLKDAKYTYDSQNRLIEVEGEGKKVSYSYDGDGLLYERNQGEETTRYYYDDEAKLIAEAKVSSSGPQITYVYVYDLSGQLQSRLEKESGKLQYYQLNGHGDVVGLTDSDGNILNSYTYDIWGGPLTKEEKVSNVLRYSGEYWDDTTGIQYLRARWYDPGTARFMSQDTYKGELADPLSLNLYTYVQNNPLTYIDPSGNAGRLYDFRGGNGGSRNIGGGQGGGGVGSVSRTITSRSLTVGKGPYKVSANSAAPLKLQVNKVLGKKTFSPKGNILNGNSLYKGKGNGTSAAKKSRSAPADTGTPNSTKVDRDKNGNITKYTTYGPDGKIVKEVRIDGQDHGSIPRPNVKEPTFNTNPKTGQQFQNGYQVRPANPDEIPNSRK